jgi:PAS domain S-box-containing protein
MGEPAADFPAPGEVSRRRRPGALTVCVAGFVAVFVFAAGAGLGALNAAGQLSDGSLALTVAGLGVFAAASVLFYRSIGRPLVRLSAQVERMTLGLPARPVAVEGPPEVAVLATVVNQLMTVARAGVKQKATLAAIVESSADAIIGKTLEGIITFWNSGAEEQYGYRAGEVMGRSVALIVPPDRPGELPAILDRVSRGERIAHMVTQRRRKDGTTVDVSLSVSPIRDAQGVVTGAATLARDITMPMRLAAERREMEHKLERAQRLESLGQLAGGIAHDFNNLLAVIVNYAGFAAEQTCDPALRADIGQITAAAKRAARITKQLLIAGRRDAVQLRLMYPRLILVDTHELLVAAAGPQVELRVHAAAGLPAIRADRGQMEQVLLNLAVNAREAMPDGGTLTFTASAVEIDEAQARGHPGLGTGRYVELAVSDTGHGMSADVAERVFDPFFTTKPAGEGTGLGLSAVQGIVTRLGGIIGVESQEGAGTTFRILLPAAESALSPPAAVGGKGESISPGMRGNRQTILVVDDEPPVLALTSRILREHGYTTLEAGTYEEALSLASSHDLQLLLTDSVMPRMPGTVLAERVTAMKPGTRVVYMSGHSTELLKERDRSGRAQYLQKPFTPLTLLDTVHSALQAATADGP